jgi:hypothetical protein
MQEMNKQKQTEVKLRRRTPMQALGHARRSRGLTLYVVFFLLDLTIFLFCVLIQYPIQQLNFLFEGWRFQFIGFAFNCSCLFSCLWEF